MAHPRIPRAIERKAVKLYTKGLSLRAVGRELGISQQGVVRVLERNFLERRRPGNPDKGIPGVAELHRLKRKWGTWKDVAFVLSCSTNTIFRHLNGRPSRRGASDGWEERAG